MTYQITATLDTLARQAPHSAQDWARAAKETLDNMGVQYTAADICALAEVAAYDYRTSVLQIIGQRAPAQEQPAQEQPAQEQPAQEQPAQEQPAQEQPAQPNELGAWFTEMFDAALRDTSIEARGRALDRAARLTGLVDAAAGAPTVNITFQV